MSRVQNETRALSGLASVRDHAPSPPGRVAPTRRSTRAAAWRVREHPPDGQRGRRLNSDGPAGERVSRRASATSALRCSNRPGFGGTCSGRAWSGRTSRCLIWRSTTAVRIIVTPTAHPLDGFDRCGQVKPAEFIPQICTTKCDGGAGARIWVSAPSATTCCSWALNTGVTTAATSSAGSRSTTGPRLTVDRRWMLVDYYAATGQRDRRSPASCQLIKKFEPIHLLGIKFNQHVSVNIAIRAHTTSPRC
jgi:hypothetical protein